MSLELPTAPTPPIPTSANGSDGHDREHDSDGSVSNGSSSVGKRDPGGGNSGGSDMLLCDICLELYNEDMRLPKFLTCFHSFCQACLIKMSSQSHNTVECPACKKVRALCPKNMYR